MDGGLGGRWRHAAAIGHLPDRHDVLAIANSARASDRR